MNLLYMLTVGGDSIFWYLSSPTFYVPFCRDISNFFLYVVACSHKSEGRHLWLWGYCYYYCWVFGLRFKLVLLVLLWLCLYHVGCVGISLVVIPSLNVDEKQR